MVRYEPQIAALGKYKTYKEVYQKISKRLRKKFDSHKTAEQVESRWKVIRNKGEEFFTNLEKASIIEDEETGSGTDEAPKKKNRMTNMEQVEYMLARRDEQRQKQREKKDEEKKKERSEMMQVILGLLKSPDKNEA